MIEQDIIDLFRIKPGKKVHLKDHETDWTPGRELKDLSKAEVKEHSQETLAKNLAELSDAQQLLYADNRFAVLMILQAMDAAGKDGTIKHVMSGVNPQGCQVFSFKKPSIEELEHDFLWRCSRCLPQRGRIGIFNRSYYEDVLVVKVHPEFLDSKKEQKRRFLARLDEPEKNWKFSAADLAERGCWSDYTEAYEGALEATSTEWTPWYIVPAEARKRLE